MTRTAVVVFAGTALAAVCLGVALPGGVPQARSEPLADVCTNADLEHHRACEVGYLAMYVPHRQAGNCEELYGREVALHPQQGPLLEPDFLAGCEAAKRELVTLGVRPD